MGSIITDGRSRSYGVKNTGKQTRSDAELKRRTQVQNNRMWRGTNIEVQTRGLLGRVHDTGSDFLPSKYGPGSDKYGPGTFRDMVDYVKAAKNIGKKMSTYGSSRHPSNTYRDKWIDNPRNPYSPNSWVKQTIYRKLREEGN